MQPPVRLPGLLDAMRGVQRAGHLGCVPAYTIQAAELGLSATVVEICRAHQRTAELSWHLRTDVPPVVCPYGVQCSPATNMALLRAIGLIRLSTLR